MSRLTLLLGAWQLEYFHRSFGLSHRKLTTSVVNIGNTAYKRNRWYYRRLPELARHLVADVVHLSFPAPVSRARFSCPLVVSLHDLYPYDIAGNFGARRVLFNRLFLKKCLQESDAIACSSDFTLERLRSIVPGVMGKAVRIHQGVALDPAVWLRPRSRQLYDRPFLLSVAQHRRNKNIALLLAAFADLRRRNPSFGPLRLVIIGAEGPETPSLRRLVQRLSLGEHVAFQVAVTDAELCWLYRNCALMVAPSIIEGFGLPVAEALSCGSRVVCSDIPAFREVGGARCSYFDLYHPNPTKLLADAIEAAMQKPPGTAQRDDRFQTTRIATQHVSLYSLLTARQSSGLKSESPAPAIEARLCDRHAG